MKPHAWLRGLLLCLMFWPAILPTSDGHAQQEPDSSQVNSGQPEPNQPESSQPKDGQPSREQTIYIPFTKLREVFEKEGRGVFLPYEQFQALWKEAREHRQAPVPSALPADAIITSVINEATIQKDVVQVEATLTIELIKQGWIQVPLRLNEAAIQSATIDGEAARVMPSPGGGYQVLVQNSEKAPRSIELKLTYARAFNKSPGRNDVSFDAPQAPVNRWRIRIPQAGVKVNVQPMIAVTEAPEPTETNKSADQTNNEKETVILAFVGAAQQVSIDWTPKTEGATGMTALTVVQAQQELLISEGTARTRATLAYNISRAELTELSVEIPGDQKVVNVFDPNVRKWDVSKDGNNQIISVELFEPVRNSQSLVIELERYLDAEKDTTLTAPTIRALNVGRQQGAIVVNVDPALRAEAKNRTGLMQIDATELPAAVAGQPWTFAYRYSAYPYELAIGIEKIQPRITVEQLVEAYLEPEQLSLDVLANYKIEGAGVFQLEFNVPAGFEVLQAIGRDVPNSTAANVDSFHLEGENNSRLIVNLAKKALGSVALLIRLNRRLDDANLLTPTGIASTHAVPVPLANQPGLERISGRLVLHTPESIRINPVNTSGLRPIAFSEVYQTIPSSREGRFPSTRATLAFAFTEQPTQLELSAERRKSQITARQRLAVRVDSGVVRYESVILFDVLYSGVKSLRIDIPAEIANDIRNRSSGLREAPLVPAPTDVAEGYVAWTFSGESELIGTQVVTLTWERKLDQLEVGKNLKLSIPALQPANVDRAWGQIVIAKTESLDVVPSGQPTGLRSIDPVLDITREAPVADAALAFEFHDRWSLELTATRYQLEEVKRSSIERALVRNVLTRSGERGVQAIYRLRSARQRLAIRLPESAQFDSQPVRINGQPVALERGDQGQLFIPLVGQDPNTSFALELRYTLADQGAQLSIPEFPEDPAVQKVYLAIYIPEERTLIGSTGPWTEEFEWTRRGLYKWIPSPAQSDEQLASWVREGVNAGAASPFQTDGTLYLFSSLRPEPPPNGDLHLMTIDERWLALLIFSPVLVLGLLLIKSPIGAKVLALAALVIAVVLCGVFAPTFARQLMNQPMYASLAIVLVAWGAWYLSVGTSLLSKIAKTLEARLRNLPQTAPAIDPALQSPANNGGEHNA